MNSEIKSILSLAAIFGLRMLAIFMFIPIFTVYAEKLTGATPFFMGIALGIYGLGQAILQLPLGACSDKWGRKSVITIGMLLFMAGSFLGASADNIYVMIFARALQGTGAIGSVLMALLADLTSEKNRTKSMAVVGISMGVFSAIAIPTGPALAAHFQFSGVFTAAAFLTMLGLVILHSVTPSPAKAIASQKSMKVMIYSVLNQYSLIKFNVSIFLLHAIFTAMFFACPLVLKPLIPDAAFFYLPILGIAFLLLFPCIMLAEKKGLMPLIFRISIGLIFLAQIILLFFHESLNTIGIALTLFFIGFNFLEAALPSMVSKLANPETKGTAMGIYSSAQFLGIFVGGTLAGVFFDLSGVSGIFIFTAILSFFWFFYGKLSNP